MTFYGLFNDEGLVEGDFHSREEAKLAIDIRYSSEDELTIEECCHDHPDQPKEGCQECPADDAEDESEEDE